MDNISLAKRAIGKMGQLEVVCRLMSANEIPDFVRDNYLGVGFTNYIQLLQQEADLRYAQPAVHVSGHNLFQ